MEKVVWKIACSFLLVLVIIGGTFNISYAHEDYLKWFNEKYGTGGTQLGYCITCHIGSNPDGNHELNPYGFDFGKGHDFEDIELMDSDDDGFSNKAEINALTFPGDPDSVPGEDSGCFIATAEVYGATYPKISALIFLCSIIAITVTVILIRRNRF